MATDSNTLLDEAKCLGCASNSSASVLLKLGILGRIASAYSAVQSFITRAGINEPSQIAAVQILAQSAVENGWWGKCDLIYPFIGGTALAHSQNLKSSNFTITWNGTVTHNANGITGNGTTGYGDTGYIPSNSDQLSQNSVHFSIYKRSNGAAFSRRYFGCASTVPNRSLACFNSTAILFREQLNDQAAFGFEPIGNGVIVGSRYDAAESNIFYNGVNQKPGTTPVPSVGIPSSNLYIMALNNNGVPATFCSGNIAQLTVGSAVTFAEYLLMATDWQTFQTALGRQV